MNKFLEKAFPQPKLTDKEAVDECFEVFMKTLDFVKKVVEHQNEKDLKK